MKKSSPSLCQLVDHWFRKLYIFVKFELCQKENSSSFTPLSTSVDLIGTRFRKCLNQIDKICKVLQTFENAENGMIDGCES